MLIIAGIQMAMHWVNYPSSEIIDYLLVDAWDIENSDALQLALLLYFMEKPRAWAAAGVQEILKYLFGVPDGYLHWAQLFPPR